MLVNNLNRRRLKGNLFGGITASIVALPLALALGLAFEAGAIAIEYIVKRNREVKRFVIIICNDNLNDIFKRLGITELIGSHIIFKER